MGSRLPYAIDIARFAEHPVPTGSSASVAVLSVGGGADLPPPPASTGPNAAPCQRLAESDPDFAG